jgi:DNA polymerase III sliding clamp (beta) subunit (PCNA family)
MLNSLKFCQGAVAAKDFVPCLTHFVIEHGRVRAFNGVIALSSPIPFDISCRPKAVPLIKTIATCTDTIQLSLTPGGKLSVKSGKFRSLIDSAPDENTPHPFPEGAIVQINGDALLKGIKAVAPFIGDDASRRWANGILVKDGSLFATNNVMLVQYWLGEDFGSVVTIPQAAIKEMLRINEPPLYAQLAEGSVTFHYENERWLRTQLYDSKAWPDFAPILDRPSVQSPIEEGFFEALEAIKPFTDKAGTVEFIMQALTTHLDGFEGATFDVPTLTAEGKYCINMLEILKGSATTIDWNLYPSPCLFTDGGRMRGALVGMRK